MGFKASEAVEALDWDFAIYGGGSGTSPEPTTEQIHRYQKRLRGLVQAMQRLQTAEVFADEDEDLSPEQVKQRALQWRGLSLEQALDRILAEQQEVLDRLGEAGNPELLDARITELVAETLGNCPNAEQIQALPHRVRFAFYGWVTGQLLSPELVAADSRPSLSLVHNA